MSEASALGGEWLRHFDTKVDGLVDGSEKSLV